MMSDTAYTIIQFEWEMKKLIGSNLFNDTPFNELVQVLDYEQVLLRIEEKR